VYESNGSTLSEERNLQREVKREGREDGVMMRRVERHGGK